MNQLLEHFLNGEDPGNAGVLALVVVQSDPMTISFELVGPFPSEDELWQFADRVHLTYPNLGVNVEMVKIVTAESWLEENSDG